jgi:hypothetical protein
VTTRTGVPPQVPEPPAPPEGASRKDAQAQREAAAVEYLEQAARSSVTTSEADLARLGEERGLNIEKALLAGQALEPTRVFKVRAGKVEAHEGKVRFTLGLQ